MLTINLVFILRKSVNYSVNLFSNRNMNSAIVLVQFKAFHIILGPIPPSLPTAAAYFCCYHTIDVYQP